MHRKASVAHNRRQGNVLAILPLRPGQECWNMTSIWLSGPSQGLTRAAENAASPRADDARKQTALGAADGSAGPVNV
jgi:hypothetical protein